MGSGKRLVDILLAGTALLVLSPLFLAIALAIRLNSAGPVFFVQQRVGVRGLE
ncbi:sugar transferase [Citrobacter youngae]|uniref:sugar transferase n=1 Tax=Citrobacter youngae TaxID=133448 RepID=UPI0013D1D77A|nr:sugar transferase [Citrobacter youngae]